MRIQALYDKNGNVLAAAIPEPKPAILGAMETKLRAGKDQYVSEFEVPTEYTNLSGIDLFQKMKIEIKDNKPKLIFK